MMKKDRVTYKEALKSQISVCIVAVLILIGFLAIRMDSAKTPENLLQFMLFIALFGGVVFYVVHSIVDP